MAALTITDVPKVDTTTLETTAYYARTILVEQAGVLSLYSTAALQYNYDDTVSEDDDMTAVVGFPVPASQGREIQITSLDANGVRQVNVWSAVTEAVVNVELGQNK